VPFQLQVPILLEKWSILGLCASNFFSMIAPVSACLSQKPPIAAFS
jgi:hypothetical protein